MLLIYFDQNLVAPDISWAQMPRKLSRWATAGDPKRFPCAEATWATWARGKVFQRGEGGQGGEALVE